MLGHFHRQNVDYKCNCVSCTRTSHRGDMPLSTFAFSSFVQQRQENGRTSLDRRLGFFSMIRGIGNRFYKYQKHIFSRVHSVSTLLIEYVWLIRMSELSGFVCILSHVTLHVKSNAEKVNSPMLFQTFSPLRIGTSGISHAMYGICISLLYRWNHAEQSDSNQHQSWWR